MATEFHADLEKVAECANQLDHEFLEDIENEETGVQYGHFCKAGSFTYAIEGDPDLPYFQVRFPFSIVGSFAGALEEDVASQYVSGSVGPDGDVRRLAVIELLESMSVENHAEFQYHLGQQLTGPGVGYKFRTTEADRVAGFDVQRRVFPQSEQFDVARYSDAVQDIINYGNQGVNFITSIFDIEAVIADGISEQEDIRYLQ